MPMPEYLYHATSRTSADKIAEDGLKPLSGGGKGTLYLCMSGDKSGATTTYQQATDIIFRVKGSSLNASSWIKSGAGKEEWRGTESIPAASLEYKRFLGTNKQRSWRKAEFFPVGLS